MENVTVGREVQQENNAIYPANFQNNSNVEATIR
jgi:hypothetical protein